MQSFPNIIGVRQCYFQPEVVIEKLEMHSFSDHHEEFMSVSVHQE